MCIYLVSRLPSVVGGLYLHLGGHTIFNSDGLLFSHRTCTYYQVCDIVSTKNMYIITFIHPHPTQYHVINALPGIKTDDNGNATFQSYLSKLSKTKPSEGYARTAAMGNTGKNVCFPRSICSRCCKRRNLCFHVENCQHADRKQLTRRYAFDLDTESTHG